MTAETNYVIERWKEDCGDGCSLLHVARAILEGDESPRICNLCGAEGTELCQFCDGQGWICNNHSEAQTQEAV